LFIRLIYFCYEQIFRIHRIHVKQGLRSLMRKRNAPDKLDAATWSFARQPNNRRTRALVFAQGCLTGKDASLGWSSVQRVPGCSEQAEA